MGGLFYTSLYGSNPLVSASLGSLVSGLIAEANRRPRNKTEWQARFSNWQKPASDTEEAKIETATRRVRGALNADAFLAQRQWAIIPQGSYHNNTNVRTDSDVDLCVCLVDAVFTESPTNNVPSMAQLGRGPLPFQFCDFKEHIATCLRGTFNNGAVMVGKKAIQLHKDDREKVSVDVVPAFRLEHYSQGPNIYGGWPSPQIGIALETQEGQRLTNFPVQHYANGCAKNDQTGRRYKRVVRILKRMRNHIAENGEVPQAIRENANKTASFLIESLVYNCPNRPVAKVGRFWAQRGSGLMRRHQNPAMRLTMPAMAENLAA